MEPKVNLPAMFSVVMGGAAVVTAFAATTLGVSHDSLWVAAVVGGVLAGVSFFVPSHTYPQQTPPAPPAPAPAPAPATPTVTVTTTTDAPPPPASPESHPADWTSTSTKG